MAPRSQPYRVEWPISPNQVENIDEMFQILFDELRNGAITITNSQLSQVLGVVNGGTGVATLATNAVLYGNGTSAVQALAVNSSATNKFLRQVSSGAPTWETGPDIATSMLAPTTDETLSAGLGATVPRSYRVASGKKLIIGSGARFRIL